jgi:hypothetical protein
VRLATSLVRSASVHSPIRDRISGSGVLTGVLIDCPVVFQFGIKSAGLLAGALFTPADGRQSRPSRQTPLPSRPPEMRSAVVHDPSAHSSAREDNSRLRADRIGTAATIT